MSFNVKNDTITVADVTYDVEHVERNGYTVLTLELDGEPVFKGLEGRVGYDDLHDHGYANPRDWTNVGTMLVNYRGYSLGDGENDDFEVECYACNGTGESCGPDNVVAGLHVRPPDCLTCDGSGMVEVDPATYYRSKRGARVVLPLYVMEHSGITIRCGSPIGQKVTEGDVRSTDRFAMDSAGWDTSFVGFTFDTPEGREECIGDDATDDEIAAALKGEVEVYASYLEGDVTEFSVEDAETGFVESCGGFVGEYGEQTMIECFEAMENAIEARIREINERAYWSARDTVTV